MSETVGDWLNGPTCLARPICHLQLSWPAACIIAHWLMTAVAVCTHFLA